MNIISNFTSHLSDGPDALMKYEARRKLVDKDGDT